MKKLVSLFLICILSFSLVSCSDKRNGSNNDKIKIFASISNEDAFISTLIDGMEEYSASQNVDLEVKYADNDVETQVEQIKDAQGDNYDAIVCLLVDADTSKQIINAAGNLPVIFINSMPDESRLKEDKYIYVGSNEEEVVDKSTKYLLGKFKNKESIDAVMLEGPRNAMSAIQRSDDLKHNIARNGLNVNYVFEDEADWKKETAKEKFKVFLKMNKNYDVILCNNDEMALGVIEAMEEEGIDPSTVPILGVDATKDGCQAIKDGKMSFTIKQSGAGQGENVIKAAKVLKDGKKIKDMEYGDKSGKYVWYPFEAVDIENVSNYIE